LPNLSWNRKLLVSVFNAQEGREAVLGGARIVDSEDPKSALGNIKPRHIMDISDAVLDFRRDLDVQLSTNIGEDQLLFRRSQNGQAIEKSPYEIAGKAAQAAIGVAASMGTRVHPINLIKVGVDGMGVDVLGEVLSEVVATLRRTEQFSHSQVMSVLFAQNLTLWNERKHLDHVRKVLVGLREFNPALEGEPLAFDLCEYAVGTLRDRNGSYLFSDRSQVSLAALIRHGVLPIGSNSSFVKVSELFEHSRYFPQLTDRSMRTNQAVIKVMVDVTADSGANAIMIDTSVLSKESNICLIDTSGSELVDFNSLIVRNELPQRGILPLEDLRFFVNYCHYRGICPNLAGSVQSYQAQQLWVLIPDLDQMSTRGAASAVDRDPSSARPETPDTRQWRIIKRSLVRGIAPPEHGGVLNIPSWLKGRTDARDKIQAICTLISEGRARLGLPSLSAYYVDPSGAFEPIP